MKDGGKGKKTDLSHDHPMYAFRLSSGHPGGKKRSRTLKKTKTGRLSRVYGSYELSRTL
jgi:hypothetical protein